MSKDGTLKYMLRDYNGSGTIFAKSGYIGRQRSYAGYITTESGRLLAFCIILDNYSCSGIRMRNKIRSEEHTSELQSRGHLVCRLLLEKKNIHWARPQLCFRRCSSNLL